MGKCDSLGRVAKGFAFEDLGSSLFYLSQAKEKLDDMLNFGGGGYDNEELRSAQARIEAVIQKILEIRCDLGNLKQK